MTKNEMYNTYDMHAYVQFTREESMKVNQLPITWQLHDIESSLCGNVAMQNIHYVIPLYIISPLTT